MIAFNGKAIGAPDSSRFFLLFRSTESTTKSRFKFTRIVRCPALLERLTRARAADPREGGMGVVSQKADSAKGTCVFPDVDEILHATSVAARNCATAGSFDPVKAITQEAAEQAAQLSSDSIGWLRAEGTPSGNVVFGFGLDGAIMIFAGLAVKAGIEEIRDASHRGAELAAKQQVTSRRLEELTNIPADLRVDASVEAAISHVETLEARSLKELDSALRHNACDDGIGVSTLVSGLAISLRTAGDFVLRIVTMVAPNAAGVIGVTTVLGIVGTLALGPIAAVAAVALGSFFVHQTRRVGEALRQDRKIFESVAPKTFGPLNAKETEYATFIEHKLSSRERFAARFNRWNAGFLSSACVCALVTAAKAGLGIAALAGVAAVVASPIGLAVMLAVGFIGAVVMGACSFHYIKNHGKSKTQQSYRLDDTPLLGRRFDDLYTQYSMSMGDANNGPSASSLRATVYEFAQVRDVARQWFLQEAATEMHKYRAWEARAVDGVELRSCKSKVRQRHKSVLARLRYIGAYAGTFAKGHGHKLAKHQARHVYGRYADGLNVENLADWLGATPDHDAGERRELMQRELLEVMLVAQRRLLTSKIEAFDAFKSMFFSVEGCLPEIVGESLASAREESERDRAALTRIENLFKAKSFTLDNLKREFLRIQGAVPDEAPNEGIPAEHVSAELNTRFARFLIEDLSDDFTKVRGILFDMHRHACHLQHDAQKTSQTNTSDVSPQARAAAGSDATAPTHAAADTSVMAQLMPQT